MLELMLEQNEGLPVPSPDKTSNPPLPSSCTCARSRDRDLEGLLSMGWTWKVLTWMFPP